MNYSENKILYLNTAKAWKDNGLLIISKNFVKVNYFLSNVIGNTDNIEEVLIGKSFTCTFLPADGYGLLANVIVNGAENFSWDSSTGLLTVSNVKSEVYIYISAVRYTDLSKYFEIKFYYNKSEANRVDKTDYLTSASVLQGVLREECDILYPSFTIESTTIPTFNYCFIPVFGNRYYFIDGITSVRNNLWRIEMHVDVLMSHKFAIYQCVGFVDRNEYAYNNNIPDNKRVVQNGQIVESDFVTNEVFKEFGYSFILSGFYAQKGE